MLGNFILDHKYLKNKVYSYPILISKIHRPYLKRFFKISSKTDAIINTYKTVDSIFNKNILEKIYLNGKTNLATIKGKDKSIFYISLELYPFFDKEGEINLKLLDNKNIALATLIFSFLNTHSNNLILFIGGIQGVPKEIDKEYIKNATKELYDIFPKKILIASLYILENVLNLNINKFCVSNQSHIYKS